MAAIDFQALNHIIRIMDCFTIEQPEAGVREVARRTGLSPSLTGRVMLALKEAGLLRQNADTRQYMLGPKVLGWAGVFTATLDVRKLALPAMQALHVSTQETISLYILDGNERVCIERMESPHSIRIVERIGRRLPLHAGSAGKLMLAFLPGEKQAEILQSQLAAFTTGTITDPDRLRMDLEKIRRAGFAFSSGEWLADAAGVAAPILNNKGELAAAISISGPSQRFTPEAVKEYTQLITQAAAEISQRLGYAQFD